MTYLSEDLNKLCRKWCQLVSQCPEGHYCVMMDKIRKQIIKISEFNEFDKEIEYGEN